MARSCCCIARIRRRTVAASKAPVGSPARRSRTSCTSIPTDRASCSSRCCPSKWRSWPSGAWPRVFASANRSTACLPRCWTGASLSTDAPSGISSSTRPTSPSCRRTGDSSRTRLLSAGMRASSPFGLTTYVPLVDERSRIVASPLASRDRLRCFLDMDFFGSLMFRRKAPVSLTDAGRNGVLPMMTVSPGLNMRRWSVSTTVITQLYRCVPLIEPPSKNPRFQCTTKPRKETPPGLCVS